MTLTEMTTQHIINRIAWLERNKAEEVAKLHEVAGMVDADGDMGHSLERLGITVDSSFPVGPLPFS